MPSAVLCDADLHGRLRSRTRTLHEALESGLDLLNHPLSNHRFRHLLERFYGFHAVWEPAAAACTQWSGAAGEASRLPLLRADLQALGLTPHDLDALPRCEEAGSLARTPGRTLGAMYVLEGSTLGGKVIGRELAKTGWAPSGGFGYFDPYGEETGARWRAFRTRLSEAPAAVHEEVAAGAVETFRLLIAWLNPAFRSVTA